MAFGSSLEGALASAMGITPRKTSSTKNKDASKIPVRKPPREKSHFTGLGPSNPLVMAPKQDTPDMQPTLGVYPGNQSSNQTRPNRSTGLPSGMPSDLGMSMGPSMQPSVPFTGQGTGQGMGPSMESLDPLMRRRMMSARQSGY